MTEAFRGGGESVIQTPAADSRVQLFTAEGLPFQSDLEEAVNTFSIASALDRVFVSQQVGYINDNGLSDNYDAIIAAVTAAAGTKTVTFPSNTITRSRKSIALTATTGFPPFDLNKGEFLLDGARDFAPADISSDNKTININFHLFQTAQQVNVFNTTATNLPGGLYINRNFFVIDLGDNQLQLAATQLDAVNGIPIEFTDLGGGQNFISPAVVPHFDFESNSGTHGRWLRKANITGASITHELINFNGVFRNVSVLPFTAAGEYLSWSQSEMIKLSCGDHDSFDILSPNSNDPNHAVKLEILAVDAARNALIVFRLPAAITTSVTIAKWKPLDVIVQNGTLSNQPWQWLASGDDISPVFAQVARKADFTGLKGKNVGSALNQVWSPKEFIQTNWVVEYGGDKSATLKALLSLDQATGIDIITGSLHYVNHQLTDGDELFFRSSGTIPTGMFLGGAGHASYFSTGASALYAIIVDDDHIQVSDTVSGGVPGAALAITNAQTGTLTVTNNPSDNIAYWGSAIGSSGGVINAFGRMVAGRHATDTRVFAYTATGSNIDSTGASICDVSVGIVASNMFSTCLGTHVSHCANQVGCSAYNSYQVIGNRGTTAMTGITGYNCTTRGQNFNEGGFSALALTGGMFEKCGEFQALNNGIVMETGTILLGSQYAGANSRFFKATDSAIYRVGHIDASVDNEGGEAILLDENARFEAGSLTLRRWKWITGGPSPYKITRARTSKFVLDFTRGKFVTDGSGWGTFPNQTGTGGIRAYGTSWHHPAQTVNTTNKQAMRTMPFRRTVDGCAVDGFQPRYHAAAGDVTMYPQDEALGIHKTAGAATGVTLDVPYPGQPKQYIFDSKGDADSNNITITPAAIPTLAYDFNGTIANLVTNGDFASGAGWTPGVGASISAGALSWSGAQSPSTSDTTRADIVLLAGTRYMVVFTSTRTAGNVRWVIGSAAGTNRGTSGTFIEVFTATTSGTITAGLRADANFIGSIDNFIIIPVFSIGDRVTGSTSGSTALIIGSTEPTTLYLSPIDSGTQKTAVRVAATANGTLATAYENGDTLDGVVLATGNRILLPFQTAATENGIYTVNASGAPTRATDADTGAEISNAIVNVTAGSVNAGTTWNCPTQSITIGVTNIVWNQGVFIDNEVITTEGGGAAVVNGSETSTTVQIVNSVTASIANTLVLSSKYADVYLAWNEIGLHWRTV